MSTLADRFLDAIASGNLARVKRFIDKDGAIVNQRGTDGFAPLYLAAQEGRTEIVNVLITNGAKVNTEFLDNVTPLYIAAECGHIGVVRTLLENGADLSIAVNDVTMSDGAIDYGSTPLFTAAANGRLDIVNLLIDRGADVNYVRTDNASALMMAAQNGHLEIVNVLLAAGANVNERTNRHGVPPGETALYAAALNGHLDIVRALLKAGAKIDVETVGNKTMEMYATEADKFDDEINRAILFGKKQKPTRGGRRKTLRRSRKSKKTRRHSRR